MRVSACKELRKVQEQKLKLADHTKLHSKGNLPPLINHTPPGKGRLKMQKVLLGSSLYYNNIKHPLSHTIVSIYRQLDCSNIDELYKSSKRDYYGPNKPCVCPPLLPHQIFYSFLVRTHTHTQEQCLCSQSVMYTQAGRPISSSTQPLTKCTQGNDSH